jgi:hypothetical protein
MKGRVTSQRRFGLSDWGASILFMLSNWYLMMTNSNSINTCLAILAFFLTQAQPAAAAEIRTYEFLPGQERLFQFQGGLLGTDVQAQLAGSFDVEIEDNGASRLTRFDVQLVDILDQGFSPLDWSEGMPLADVLFVNPVGLIGNRDATLITLGDPGDIIAYDAGIPYTIIRVSELGGGQAQVRISSLPEMVIDSPSFFTESPGLLVRMVPEPAGLVLSISGALACLACCDRRRRWRSSW